MQSVDRPVRRAGSHAEPERTSVPAFAADFEQHCEDGAPGLFGAIRYNSTIGDLLPFGGNYPLYQLTITPHANGRVSGGGVDCGAGNSVCQVLLPDAAHVSITATPEVGYLFTGWTGSCRGTPTTSVHVNSQKTCAALFEPLVSSAPRTLFYWESQAGDFVGRGGQGVLSPAISQWSLTSWENGNSVDIYISDGTETWRLDFSAPEGSPLSVGYYGAARRYPVTPLNGLSVSGHGRGCNRITGRFAILEIVLGSDGTVERFAADFEQHCEDAVPALVGSSGTTPPSTMSCRSVGRIPRISSRSRRPCTAASPVVVSTAARAVRSARSRSLPPRVSR